MHMRAVFGIFAALLAICDASLADRCEALEPELQRSIDRVINKGIETKTLFVLGPNQKMRQSGFAEFYYAIPASLDGNNDLTQDYIGCLRECIAKRGIVGPQRRPLSLMPRSSRKAQTTYRYEDEGASYGDLAGISNCRPAIK